MRPAYAVHVGKESNKLEEVEAGREHDPEEVWTEFTDSRRDPWRELVLPVLRQMPLAKLEGLGLHRRSLFAIRAGEHLSHPGTDKRSPPPLARSPGSCWKRRGASRLTILRRVPRTWSVPVLGDNADLP